MPTGYRRILIGSDLEPLPKDIIEEIQKLVGQPPSLPPTEIHLAFILEAFQNIPVDLPLAGLDLPSVAEDALQRLDRIARTLGPLSANISTGIYQGKADKVLAALAVSQKADLILLISHGRPLLNRLITGSLPGSLVHLSPVPVLVIKDKTRKEELATHLLAHLPGETLTPLAHATVTPDS